MTKTTIEGKSARKVATTKATEAALTEGQKAVKRRQAAAKGGAAKAAVAKTAKAAKPAPAPKAPKTAKATQAKAPKPRGKQGVVTINDPKFVFGCEGSTRRASWDALAKLPANGRTLAAYKAAGGLTKYIKRWESAGVITVKGAA